MAVRGSLKVKHHVMKKVCSAIVRWRDFIPFLKILLLIVSLVCQILLIVGLNIRSVQLTYNVKSDRELADRSD